MVEILNLKKAFNIGEKEFNTIGNVSFKVDRGKIYGIIGLSGTGKSTPVRPLNRLEGPTSGKVTIDDVDITSLRQEELLEARKEISTTFQYFNLLNQKNVYGNITYPLKLQNVLGNGIEKRANELLDLIGLRDKAESHPSQLSGGQKQRVTIARALSTNPKVILSDESINALDPQNIQQILEIPRELVDEYKTTIIVIAYQVEVARDVCDRIAVMENREIIGENSVEELFRSPKADVAKNFIRELVEEDGEEITTDDSRGDIVRLTHSRKPRNKPSLSQAARISGIDFSIISGNTNKFQFIGVGYIAVGFIGEEENIQKAKDFLTKNDIKVEGVR